MNHQKDSLITNEDALSLLKDSMSVKTLTLLRMCLTSHLATSMGVQMTNVNQGPENTRMPFMPQFVLTFTQQLLEVCTPS